MAAVVFLLLSKSNGTDGGDDDGGGRGDNDDGGEHWVTGTCVTVLLMLKHICRFRNICCHPDVSVSGMMNKPT